MNLLAGTLYDPGTAVNKVTTSLLAMTALDTTNLRHTVTVPPSGRIMWEIEGTLHGATTCPQIMLGVMEGATVRGRAAPMHGATNIAATSLVKVSAKGIITGLTPGASIVLDAAYGVETVLASTGLKYGGPNNTTGNDNFGGLLFALWDPSPIYTPSAVPATPISARIDTIDDFIDTEIAALTTAVGVIDDFLDTEIAAIKAKTDNLPADPADASDIMAALTVIDDFIDTEVGAVKAVTDKLDTALELDGAVYRFTTNALEQGAAGGGGGLDAAGVRAAIGLASANLDTQLAGLDGKLDTIDNLVDSEIGAIGTDVDDIQSRLPAALVGGRMASIAEVVGDKTGYALTVAEHAAVSDKLLGRNIAGGSDAGRKVHEALAALRNRWAIEAGVLTIYDEDDATPLFTAAVTRAAGDPITQMDPA